MPTRPPPRPAAIEIGDDEVPVGKVDETIEEIRFYLEHGMPDQAASALAKLQTLTRDEGKLATIRAEVEAASQPAAPPEVEEPETVAEFTIEEPVAEAAQVELAEEESDAEPEPVALGQGQLSPAHQAIHTLLEATPSVPEAEPGAREPEPSGLKELCCRSRVIVGRYIPAENRLPRCRASSNAGCKAGPRGGT